MSLHDKPPMTVGDLIQALAHLDRSKPVAIEGCDCDGWAGSVATWRVHAHYGSYVALERALPNGGHDRLDVEVIRRKLDLAMKAQDAVQ